jgi:hypothetical protein
VSRSTGRVEATDDAIRTYLSRWFFVDLLSTLPLDRTFTLYHCFTLSMSGCCYVNCPITFVCVCVLRTPLPEIVLWLLSNAQSHSAVRSLALMRILRLTRLFKFLRLMRLSRIRSRYQGVHHDWSKLSLSTSSWARAKPAGMRLVWAVVCMLFAAHVIACGWSGLLVYQVRAPCLPS